MHWEEIKALDPKKISSWPRSIQLGLLILFAVVIWTGAYFWVWQDQWAQIEVEQNKTDELKGIFLEKKKLIQSAKELTTEIVKLGLVDSNLENALFYGLQVQIEYEGFNTLSNHLKKYKTSLKNSEDDEYEKMQIVELVNEAINDFKIHRSISEV